MRNPFRRRETATAQSVEVRSTGIQLAPYGALRGNFYEGRWGGAMGIPAVLRAATLLSSIVGEMQLEGIRAGKVMSPTPAMLADPAAGIDNSGRVMASWVLDGLFEGNAIGVVAARNSDGWPTAILPVPARWVQVRYYNGGGYNLLDNYGSRIEYVIQDHVFDRRDIFHVKLGPCEPGALRGVGLLENACGSFDLAGEQQRQARSLASYGVPTGVLQAAENSGVTQQQMQDAADAWVEAQSTRTIAGLAPGVKFEALSWNPSEAQMIEAREFTTREIALVFGIPADMLEAAVKGANIVYTNMAQQDLQLLKYTVNSLLVAFEQEFSRHMPRGCTARFDRSVLLEMDVPTRYAAYTAAIASGWLLPSEVRAEEGLDPIPNLDPIPPGEHVNDVNSASEDPASQPVEDPQRVPLPADDDDDTGD